MKIHLPNFILIRLTNILLKYLIIIVYISNVYTHLYRLPYIALREQSVARRVYEIFKY